VGRPPVKAKNPNKSGLNSSGIFRVASCMPKSSPIGAGKCSFLAGYFVRTAYLIRTSLEQLISLNKASNKLMF
jgi:hypothetical protein